MRATITVGQAPTISDRRKYSRECLADKIAAILEPHQADGFFGEIPLEINLRDGVIESVVVTGPRRRFKIAA